jgi:hypothetical protein
VQVEDDNEPGVTILHGRGHVENAETKIAPLHGELSQCYTSRVGRRRWLGGRVLLKWNIRADGTIDKVVLAESDLGAWPIEKCLLDVARTAEFGAPVGGKADVTLPLDFQAPGVVETWEDDRALKAVGGQLAKLDEGCAASAAPPDDVTITLYVGPHGKAQSVGFASPASEIADDWGKCAEKAALRWRLPDPRGKVGKLAVRYRSR